MGAILAGCSGQMVGHCITFYFLYCTFMKCYVLLGYHFISSSCSIKLVLQMYDDLIKFILKVDG